MQERWVLAAVAAIFLVGLVARHLHLRRADQERLAPLAPLASE